jgi:hypothetical protein
VSHKTWEREKDIKDFEIAIVFVSHKTQVLEITCYVKNNLYF